MLSWIVMRGLRCLGVLALVVGHPARAETLADAIAAAYRHNPLLLAQRAELRATDEGLAQANAAYGPTISAEVSRLHTFERNVVASGVIAGSATATTITGTVDQPLFTSGRLSGNVRIARATIDQSREALRSAEASVLRDAITAYVSVRRDQQLLAIAEENLALLGRQLDDTRTRLKAGESTATDLDQTDVRTSFARARAKEAVASLEASRSRYLDVVGNLPGALAPEPPLPGLPETLDAAYAAADVLNPDLRAAQARELASRAAIGVARAEFGPVVSLRGNGGRGAVSLYGDDPRTFYTAGVVATLPLANGGLTSSRIREAQARNDQDWRLIDQTRRDVRRDIAVAWEQLVSFRGTIGDYGVAVERAEAAVAGAREQERAGVRSTLDVLDQVRDLLDARTALTSARANEYLARVALLASTGRLEAPLLIGIAAEDPTANYRRVNGPLSTLPTVPVLNAVDAALQGSAEPRASRDPAAATAKPATAPLPPRPAAD